MYFDIHLIFSLLCITSALQAWHFALPKEILLRYYRHHHLALPLYFHYLHHLHYHSFFAFSLHYMETIILCTTSALHFFRITQQFYCHDITDCITFASPCITTAFSQFALLCIFAIFYRNKQSITKYSKSFFNFFPKKKKKEKGGGRKGQR